ncbi:hypothetical protein HHL11_20120 [Ramlibacter sp. G-1-2-2]|uniref:Uncharacterized protein n=1 Tax=Ramlibacter agri TaxID=2728837 RepID=A0A848H5J8_9BURK|nr:hypothetical protein [Ramlibacter agri]NML46065.1 hypothetical protein [Ramlibacter agri]
MQVLRPWPALGLALVLVLAAGQAAASGVLGAEGLRAQHASLAPQLASSPLKAPLVMKSEEASRRIEGEMYAVLDQPFATVSSALADPAHWCDILILHLNNKQCQTTRAGADTVLELKVGNTYKQPAAQASTLRFTWKTPEVQPDYLGVQMSAAQGPYSTQDYQLVAEAVPLEGDRTFLHMTYAFGYGAAGSIAFNVYFGTAGKDKVGFSPANGNPPFVGGARGLMERNTMRYFLCIQAYLDTLAAASDDRLERRMEAWFDGTEKYPRQLHEMERAEYLKMKRVEAQR